MKTVLPLTTYLSSNNIDGSNYSSGTVTNRSAFHTFTSYNNFLSMTHNATLYQPTSTTKPLKMWFDKNIDNPYPTKDQKIMLSMLCNMTMIQVSTWFANARRRRNKEYREYCSGKNCNTAFEQQNENLYSAERWRENMRNRPSDDLYTSPENYDPIKRGQNNEIWSIENIISSH